MSHCLVPAQLLSMLTPHTPHLPCLACRADTNVGLGSTCLPPIRFGGLQAAQHGGRCCRCGATVAQAQGSFGRL